MLPILQIGPLALPVPALIVLLGFWIGLELAERHAGIFGVDSGRLYNTTLAAVIGGILGARISYAAGAPEAFLQSPLSLLALTPQMLNATGGVLVGLAVALVFLRAQHIALWPALDALTTLFSVLAVTIALSNLASGSGFGSPTSLPWAVELWGEQRHPTQIYEGLAALIIGAVLWPGARAAAYSIHRPGFRLWLFLALSAGAQLILETYRGDSTLLLNSFRAAQAAAWFILAVSLWQIGKRFKPLPYLHEETGV